MTVDESKPDDTNLAAVIAPHLPLLRRFARALSGNQSSGDRLVANTLEAMIADRSVIDLSHGPRPGLYRLFHQLWTTVNLDAPAHDDGEHDNAISRVARLTPRPRQVLLLTSVEDFELADAAFVMGIDESEATGLLEIARTELAAQMQARVMIIEDEPIIALDLETIVSNIGHSVTGVADTHATAVELAEATPPDLILADIQLADGSSGIDAVAEILGAISVPVIFITAYPERLLTGERTEPTYLITKPFRPETVETAISQVLFHAQIDSVN